MRKKKPVNRRKRIGALALAAAAVLTFTACGGSRTDAGPEPSEKPIQAAEENSGDTASVSTKTPDNETASASGKLELSGDAMLTGLKYSQWGMRVYSFYSIRPTEEGYECSITGSELYWPGIDGEETAEYHDFDPETGYGYDRYSSLGDPFDPDGPKFSRVLLQEEDVKELGEALLNEGVLSWDGYDEKWEPPAGMEVTDTGETFDLRLQFSDGYVLHAHGVDTRPENFDAVWGIIWDFFETHQDYSRYYPTDLPDEPINTLIVQFYDPYHSSGTPVYLIELHKSWDNQWTIRLCDPKGEFLPAGTDISEYERLGDSAELPVGRFYDILKKYGLGSWNQTMEHDPENTEHWSVTVYYENGQEYRVDTNLKPDQYASFREEMIRAIINYYEEVRPGNE